MKTYCKISVVVLLSFAFIACNKPAKAPAKQQPQLVEEQSTADTVHISDTVSFIEKKIYTFICADGHKRAFYDIYWDRDGSEFAHDLGVQDNDDSKTNRILPLVYQRYEDVPDFFAFIGGCPKQFRYTISPDKKYLYIVTCVMANSNGWTSEYQLFKVNCETEDIKFICDCAAMAVTDSGFTVVQARLTNRDEARCNADMIYVMHDEFLDWDGNVVRVSDEEYDYDMMDVKYLNDDDSYLKGFKI